MSRNRSQPLAESCQGTKASGLISEFKKWILPQSSFYSNLLFQDPKLKNPAKSRKSKSKTVR